jgi:hypothetical protein
MRFLAAFRSPTPGGFPELCAALFPFLTLSVRVPLFGAADKVFFFIFGFARRTADVEKCAIWGWARPRDAIEERAAASSDSWERPRTQMDRDMAKQEARGLYGVELGWCQ